MAGTDRKTAHDLAQLIEAVEEKPHEFGFFPLLRLIECLCADKPRLGKSLRPVEDPIRIGQEPATCFESASLTAFEAAKGARPPRLTVRCLGLLGPNGPLPLHLTEYALERRFRHGDRTFARFLDLFHHRMLSLFYRAWANTEPTVSFDRPESDRFSYYVGAFAGLGMSALRQRDPISDLTKLHYSGWLSGQTKCAEGLQEILSDYFDMPVCIEPFSGGWLTLPAESVCRLGLDPENGSLGRSTVCGSRVWDCQHKFRIILGPLGFGDYESLLPVGKRIGRLVALVRNYIGDDLLWDLQLILKRTETPVVRLNDKFRLGWTTWLGQRPSEKDPDDLTFNAVALLVRQPEENSRDRD